MAEEKEFHEQTHREFDRMVKHWRVCRVLAEEGEPGVKEAGTEFLPETPGMIAARSKGLHDFTDRRYKAMVERAELPDLTNAAVESAAGMMTDTEATAELGSYANELTECATPDGDTLDDLHLWACEEVVTTGGGGLITNVNAAGTAPLVVPYSAEQIVNWRYAVRNGKRVMVELVIERDEDGQTERVHYQLTDIGLVLRLWIKRVDSRGKVAWEGAEIRQPFSSNRIAGYPETQSVAVGNRQGYRLPFIPFTWLRARARGRDDEPCRPPFLGLAHQCLSAYKQDANYKESLSFHEPTPVIIGAEGEPIEGEDAAERQARLESAIPEFLGTGSMIVLPRGGDAKMLEYTGQTIANQREAIRDTLRCAERYAAMPFEGDTRQVESGEAKRERRQSAAAPLKVTAKSVGSSIEKALRLGALWLGDTQLANGGLKFTPSLDFGDEGMPPQLIMALNAAVAQATLSRESVVDLFKEAGLVGRTEAGAVRSVAEEMALADSEAFPLSDA